MLLNPVLGGKHELRINYNRRLKLFKRKAEPWPVLLGG